MGASSQAQREVHGQIKKKGGTEKQLLRQGEEKKKNPAGTTKKPKHTLVEGGRGPVAGGDWKGRWGKAYPKSGGGMGDFRTGSPAVGGGAGV